MGFDLENFFEEIVLILEYDNINMERKIALIQEFVSEQKQYAKECGNI